LQLELHLVAKHVSSSAVCLSPGATGSASALPVNSLQLELHLVPKHVPSSASCHNLNRSGYVFVVRMNHDS
jgi:hypothetical protein